MYKCYLSYHVIAKLCNVGSQKKVNWNVTKYEERDITVEVNGTNKVEIVCDYQHAIRITSAKSIFEKNTSIKELEVIHVLRDLCEDRNICKFIPKTVTFKKYDDTTQLYIPNLCVTGVDCKHKLNIKYKCLDNFMSSLKENPADTFMVSQEDNKHQISISCYKRDYIEIISVDFLRYKKEHSQEAQELIKKVYEQCNGKKYCVFSEPSSNKLGFLTVTYRCSEPLYSYYKYTNPKDDIKVGQFYLLSNEMANVKIICPTGLVKIKSALWEVDTKCHATNNIFDRTNVVGKFCDEKAICTFVPSSYISIDNSSLKYLNMGGLCRSEYYHKLKITFDCQYNHMNNYWPTWIKTKDVVIGQNTKIECDAGRSVDIYTGYWGTDDRSVRGGHFLDYSEKIAEYCNGKGSCDLKPSAVGGNGNIVMPTFFPNIPYKLKLRYACRRHAAMQYDNSGFDRPDIFYKIEEECEKPPAYLASSHQQIAKPINISNGTIISVNSTFDFKSSMAIIIGHKIRITIDAHRKEVTIISGYTSSKHNINEDMDRFVFTILVLGGNVFFNFEYSINGSAKIEHFTHEHIIFEDKDVKDIVKMYSNIAPNEFKVYYGVLNMYNEREVSGT